MQRTGRIAVLLLAAATGAGGCSASPASAMPELAMTDALRADLRTVAGARVFFAHQSVGANVLGGVAALAREAQIPLNIAHPDGDPSGPVLLEAAAGQNKDPDSKFAYFSHALAGMTSNPPRVAALKLCFVDFDPTTDADALFERYRKTVTALQAKYPSVTFMHVTTPLTVLSGSMKDKVKRLFGRSVWQDDTNARRRAYNDLLKKTFAGQPIFDLAAVESTRPDGSTETFKARDGQTTAALFPGYASDGEHLNDAGSRRAAAAFVHTIAMALR